MAPSQVQLGFKQWEVEFFGGPWDGRRGQTNRNIWYVPRIGGNRVAVYTRTGGRMIYQGDSFTEQQNA